MPAANSTTRWRDQPLVPEDYEDVAAVVRVARKARGRIVEFDWVFTRDDLEGLRRAVHEWGSPVAGRYKCFDARVLAAISNAIGDTDTTIYVLNEPKDSALTDCRASCVGDGDLYRLHGHAPFDIIFGYGSAGVDQNSTGSVHLGPTVRVTLAAAVGMLGWDLRRLQESRFVAARNALYGLRLDYGIHEIPPPSGPATDVSLHFHGPFSAMDEGGYRCLFADAIAESIGVYLWTVNVEGNERPWYVGQTRRGFGRRMGEHLAAYLSGEYLTYDAAALARGENRRVIGAVSGGWPQLLPSFLGDYERLAPKIIDLIRLIRFYVAPLAGDKHLYDRVEGAIGHYYKTHPDIELRDFFSPGLRVPAAVPYDTPIRLVLSSEASIAGLPQYLLA